MQALTFRNTQFDITDRNGQPWLRANQIGLALDYADGKAIQRIYARHKDEFTDAMTGVVKLTTPSGEQDARIFSLRGAHLLAMFARTEVAKEFRRWVLDVLDGLSAQDSVPAEPATPAEPIHLTYNDRPFRIVPEEGAALWFVAADVAHALDMRDAYLITRHLRSEHKALRHIGNKRLSLIDRQGLELALHHASPARSEPLRLWLEAALEQFVTGAAPRALLGGLSGEQQGALKALVSARIEDLPETARGRAAKVCWSALKAKFGCGYKEIAPEQFTEAVSLVARIVLEGELLEPEAPKVLGRLPIDFPIEDWKARNPHQFQHDDPRSNVLTMTCGDVLLNEYSPAEALLGQLAEAGYRVDGPLYELRSLRSLAKRLDLTMRLMAGNLRQALDGFESDRRTLQRFEGAKAPR